MDPITIIAAAESTSEILFIINPLRVLSYLAGFLGEIPPGSDRNKYNRCFIYMR
jgi:hypothetical protein